MPFDNRLPQSISARLCRAAWLCLICILISACTPTHKPVTPGTIPQAKTPSAEEEQYGHYVLTKLSEKYELDYNHPRYDEVIDVVERLTKAAKADQDPWHVYVFKDDSFVNAAATRGNHVFIWTGMLNATQNETELATVLAHEISHVLAGHTDPDPSEQLKKILINVGSIAAQIAITRGTGNPSLGQNLGQLAGAMANEVGSEVLINPYSRERELEADHIGFFLMSSAKYDPRLAVDFWTRAQSDPNLSSQSSFLSSHPATKDRLEQLKRLLPNAIAVYEGRAPAFVPPKNTSSTPATQSKDSFDIREPNPASSQPRQAQKTKLWRVSAEITVLYEKPNLMSKPIGEFTQGAVVESIHHDNTWLEVQKPDHGFLFRKQLKPY